MTPAFFPTALSAALFSLFASGCSTLSSLPPQPVEVPALEGNLSGNIFEFQNRLIQDEETGSNVALVFKDGEKIYHRVVNSGKAGDRDIAENTLFPIWSMSKPITIVAMMTLHEKGLFDWDDPVSKYMPCFEKLMVREGETVRPAKEPLRVKHLMTHRSGYTYYLFGTPHEYGSPHPNQTRFHDLQDYVEVAAKTPVNFEPGTDYVYGINQAILGRLVEVLGGQSFSDYLQDTIFKPLVMTETSFVLDEERRSRFQPLFINSGSLKGFTYMLDELNYNPASHAHFGGEGLLSTLGDYSRFCEMLLNGGEFRGQRIISEDSIATMTQASTKDFDELNVPGFDMGFSLFVMSDPARDGTRTPKGIFGWAGYHNTHFWIDPATNLYALFMSRAREFNFDIPRQLRVAIYGKLD
ncbi:MAG: serine hydrolase domain-containing protein [Planctomycetota bacterium]|nr:serine hydrolase domain-containing protein [Planctomycetota bacterium]